MQRLCNAHFNSSFYCEADCLEREGISKLSCSTLAEKATAKGKDSLRHRKLPVRIFTLRLRDGTIYEQGMFTLPGDVFDPDEDIDYPCFMVLAMALVSKCLAP